MQEVVVEITNELGLHARPAAMFVQTASKFKADILVEKEGRQVDGKSILGIMTLAARKGSQIKLSAEGLEAGKALTALEDLVNRGFEDHH